MCISCLTCLAPVAAPEGSFCSEFCLNAYLALSPMDCVDAYWDGRAERVGFDITDYACQNCGLTYCHGECYNIIVIVP
jgi:hypothetical protein